MPMKKNKVLVTGAAGFLGSHLAEKLASNGDTVVGIDNMQGGYSDNVPKNIKFHNFSSLKPPLMFLYEFHLLCKYIWVCIAWLVQLIN